MRKLIICLLQFTFVALSPFVNSETTKPNSPFAWSVQRDGKTHHILGTIHAGVSLEELPCSDEILKQIQVSDLVFLEVLHALTLLNRKDMVEFFTESKEKRERILNNFSFSAENQQKIREMIKSLLQIKPIVNSLYLTQEGDEGFEDLSEEAKEFLISHGADIQGSYVDYAFFISRVTHYKAIYSFDHMEFQIAAIVLAENIKTRALNNPKTAEELEKKKKKYSEDPLPPITQEIIESLVNNHYPSMERIKQAVFKKAELYISGNEEEIIVSSSHELDSLERENALWLEKFKEAHASPEYESLFLAGGVRHFIGSFNLIDQLRKEGFSVNRMTCSTDNS